MRSEFLEVEEVMDLGRLHSVGYSVILDLVRLPKECIVCLVQICYGM